MNNLDLSYICDGIMCESFDDGYCLLNNSFVKNRNGYLLKHTTCLMYDKYDLLNYQNNTEKFPKFNNNIFFIGIK